MKDNFFPIKLYIKHKPNIYLLGVSLLLNISSWVWLAWNIRPQQENIFLHYTALFGVDLVGEWYKVFYLPIVGLLLFLINGLIGWIVFRKDKTIGYISNGLSIFLQIIILIASHLLVLLNV